MRIARPGGRDLEEVAIDAEASPSASDGHAAVNVLHALEALAEVIRGGLSFRSDFEDAVYLHRLIDGVARASDDSQWVRLDEIV